MRFLPFVVALAAVGCANVTVKPVLDQDRDERVRGFRYYRASPYILVYTDNKGGLSSRTIMLPDTTKKMSARPWTVMASTDSTLEFQNGVLTGAQTKTDTTAVPVAVIKAAEKAAVEFAKMGFNVAQRSESAARVPPPSLFKIVPAKNRPGFRLVGGEGITHDGKPADIFITIQSGGRNEPKK